MEEQEEPTGNTCVHYWIIESPPYKRRNYRAEYTSLGSWSRGVCKKCKKEEKFDNSPTTKQINVTYSMKLAKGKEDSLQNETN